jgi:hypothetical protein
MVARGLAQPFVYLHFSSLTFGYYRFDLFLQAAQPPTACPLHFSSLALIFSSSMSTRFTTSATSIALEV